MDFLQWILPPPPPHPPKKTEPYQTFDYPSTTITYRYNHIFASKLQPSYTGYIHYALPGKENEPNIVITRPANSNLQYVSKDLYIFSKIHDADNTAITGELVLEHAPLTNSDKPFYFCFPLISDPTAPRSILHKLITADEDTQNAEINLGSILPLDTAAELYETNYSYIAVAQTPIAIPASFVGFNRGKIDDLWALPIDAVKYIQAVSADTSSSLFRPPRRIIEGAKPMKSKVPGAPGDVQARAISGGGPVKIATPDPETAVTPATMSAVAPPTKPITEMKSDIPETPIRESMTTAAAADTSTPAATPAAAPNVIFECDYSNIDFQNETPTYMIPVGTDQITLKEKTLNYAISIVWLLAIVLGTIFITPTLFSILAVRIIDTSMQRSTALDYINSIECMLASLLWIPAVILISVGASKSVKCSDKDTACIKDANDLIVPGTILLGIVVFFSGSLLWFKYTTPNFLGYRNFDPTKPYFTYTANDINLQIDPVNGVRGLVRLFSALIK